MQDAPAGQYAELPGIRIYHERSGTGEPLLLLLHGGFGGTHIFGHQVAAFSGQLTIIPGASHGVFMEKADLLNRIVLDFLAETGEPATMLPVRRAARPAASA